MATYGYAISAGPAVTGLIATNLTDGAADDSDSFDFGAAPQPFKVSLEATLNCATGTTGSAAVYILWSQDNTNFDDSGNGDFIGNIQCAASSTVIKNLPFVFDQRYAKIRIVNNSGGTINATGTSFTLSVFKGDQP